jgi:hypothetical protein
MPRPNIRFSIVVFGTALTYTLISTIVGAGREHGVNFPLLFISIIVMSIIGFSVRKNENSKTR